MRRLFGVILLILGTIVLLVGAVGALAGIPDVVATGDRGAASRRGRRRSRRLRSTPLGFYIPFTNYRSVDRMRVIATTSALRDRAAYRAMRAMALLPDRVKIWLSGTAR